MDEEAQRLKAWTSRMLKGFLSERGEECVSLNGHPTDRLPHNFNVYFKGVENKALIASIQFKVAISAGSACTTMLVEPSHVIAALGYPAERAYCSVRFGLGRFTTEEVDYAMDTIISAVRKLRTIRN